MTTSDPIATEDPIGRGFHIRKRTGGGAGDSIKFSPKIDSPLLFKRVGQSELCVRPSRAVALGMVGMGVDGDGLVMTLLVNAKAQSPNETPLEPDDSDGVG